MIDTVTDQTEVKKIIHLPQNANQIELAARKKERKKERKKAEYDHKLKDRERAMLETTFDLLPADILSHISRVDVLPRGHGSLARMWQDRGYGRGILEVNRELFTKDERPRELITLHEVAGHGLLDGANALSKEQFEQIRTKWKSIFELFPDLINKDKNGSSDIHKDEEGIGGLTLNEEEFIADRLAEYFVTRSKKYSDEQITFLRKPETPFTADEETIVRNACEETYGIFYNAAQQYDSTATSHNTAHVEIKKAA